MGVDNFDATETIFDAGYAGLFLTSLLHTAQLCFVEQNTQNDFMPMTLINIFIRRNIKMIETVAVVMRIGSFSVVSWLGPHSPFLIVWIVNTIDAIGLSWCAILKKDMAYTLLNVFWVIIGAIGIARASGLFG
ncbi:MAG: hypothetical protein WBN75_11450 [Verrucomicrobiia bacterium]